MPDSTKPLPQDEDAALGATEDDTVAGGPAAAQTSMAGQLGHRDQDELLKSSDSDFPEPDAAEEHSGEKSA